MASPCVAVGRRGSPCVAVRVAALDGPRAIAQCWGMDPVQRWAVALTIGVATTVGGGLTSGCAGFGEAAGGVCLALAIQTVGQVCCEAACGAATSAVCDGDSDDGDHVGDITPAVAPDEIPPPPQQAAPPCRIQQAPGGVWHLDCVDGTSAEALQHEPPARDPAQGDAPPGAHQGADTTVPGDVRVATLADVERLAGVRAVMGSLTVTGVTLLQLTLPSLQSVEGDLVVADTVHLGTMTLSSLRCLGGGLRVVGNRALRADPVPALTDADDVDVAFNDGLPTTVADRLLAIRPRHERARPGL